MHARRSFRFVRSRNLREEQPLLDGSKTAVELHESGYRSALFDFLTYCLTFTQKSLKLFTEQITE